MRIRIFEICNANAIVQFSAHSNANHKSLHSNAGILQTIVTHPATVSDSLNQSPANPPAILLFTQYSLGLWINTNGT